MEPGLFEMVPEIRCPNCRLHIESKDSDRLIPSLTLTEPSP